MHIPVLLNEVLEYLNPKPGENFIDATYGLGGHTAAILEKNGPKGKVLGIELDPVLYRKLKVAKLPLQRSEARPDIYRGGKNRLILVNDSFINLKEIIQKYNFHPVHGILFDLGISSWHLEESGRGFSYKKDEPLDMRYGSLNQGYQLTAKDIVNKWPQSNLIKIFKEYGEERYAPGITNRILKERETKPILRTSELVEIIKKAIPPKARFKRIHFARRVFQALRIAVNQELENLKIVLPQALDILEKEGRLVVISFHSLEDRTTKNFLKEKAKEGSLKILTKKPVRPGQKEIQYNPRSRSAKLRAAIKV